jgi:hypothetical protein
MFRIIGFIFINLLAIGNLSASPIVNVTSSGTAGSYTLDFEVINNISSSYNQDLYFFGVDLAPNSMASPTGWGQWAGGAVANYGPKPGGYASAWFGSGGFKVESGESLSGFTVEVASLPLNVNWFVFGASTVNYDLGDNYNGITSNPGFVGSASVPITSVTEPTGLALIGLGFLGLGLSRRFKKQA